MAGDDDDGSLIAGIAYGLILTATLVAVSFAAGLLLHALAWLFGGR